MKRPLPLLLAACACLPGAGNPDDRAAALAAIEAHDSAATILFGERVLARQAGDLAILDGVAQALIAAGDATAAQRGLNYALRIEELCREMPEAAAPPGRRGIGHALVLESRATAALGRIEEALTLARRAYETFPDADSAREIARWSERVGKSGAPPSVPAGDPMAFTLTAPGGGTLAMAGLKGKVVVLDFWATWCVPCRAQHPLFLEAAGRFRDNPGVVFLSIDADDDRSLAAPFLDEQKWPGPVYFEGGLARALGVFAYPSTIVLDKRGQVFSRLNGFVPERYRDTLTARVRAALDLP